MDLFKEIIPSILVSGNHILKSDEDYKSYVPYVVNRALSFHYDCIFIVNEINLYPGAMKPVQYTFLLNSVRHYRRPFQPWVKKEVIEDIDLIKQYYGYSEQKSKEALTILTRDQLNDIRKRLDQGGTT